MTAFMEAVGHAPAALSALHALGALMRLWQHRRSGKSGPCRCAPPDVCEDPGRSEECELLVSSLAPSPGPVVTVTLEGLPAGAVAVVTVTTALGAPGQGRW
ncbi:hypothetical protein [Streptomyces sp. NBC_01006]|uniref:hypothetical protein n=1 Tax=Streptomyces sp. NBC_01006 TaxID=2903716 RepID=UPI00386A48B0|nr:hypothetical protein OG509_42230 [Streptomyces sp. NBC_01006]